jgi:lipoprotein-anchoring transpeptidase ErfK/SrfK
MTSRYLAALIAAATLVGSAGLAHAQADNGTERQQMLFGGAPRAKNYSFFGSDATRTRVNYSGREKPGTIVVNTAERKLYLVQDGGNALRYAIGVGRAGFQWKGVHKVSAKKEWPGWTPPPQMRARQRGLPAHMAGGEDNPLGARAMYLGTSQYRIHGTNDPSTIGKFVSSGCIRLTNEDVSDLFSRVDVGTKVVVLPKSGAPHYEAKGTITVRPTAAVAPRPVAARPDRQAMNLTTSALY